ncbi:O-methyltransferase [Bifidobacterium simiarum]|uniref:Methyltransferase n=1 Tax=Bifidobacterium simiarum TaxID=2045441 RepID=A0A2M9HEN2_9BIFI|nr:class I SAM-dependent methyltransferase [Bifidobacterium simiarum]MBT1167292.1 class I SAM-dependent methyltransferase [Bifidobacterium simiarum]PJM75261.1 methyltransferase [Bifidobacterium simiarum]
MNRTDYTNLAKGWEFIEDTAYAAEPPALHRLRRQCTDAGFTQGSAAQAGFLAMQARQLKARSVIVLGSGSVVESAHLLEALESNDPDVSGQLTTVDSSAQGTSLIRRVFSGVQDGVRTKLRVVNAKPSVYFPRLNAGDYDLIVINGENVNYESALDHAHRLLRVGGELVMCDVLAVDVEGSRGGLLDPADHGDKATHMRQLIDETLQDERFVSCIVPIGTGMLLSIKQ